jgi:hypothetical protein
MIGFRGPLLPLGLSATPTTWGFRSALFLLGLATTEGVTPPVVVAGGSGRGVDWYFSEEEEMLTIIAAFMHMKNA